MSKWKLTGFWVINNNKASNSHEVINTSFSIYYGCRTKRQHEITKKKKLQVSQVYKFCTTSSLTSFQTSSLKN